MENGRFNETGLRFSHKKLKAQVCVHAANSEQKRKVTLCRNQTLTIQINLPLDLVNFG